MAESTKLIAKLRDASRLSSLFNEAADALEMSDAHNVPLVTEAAPRAPSANEFTQAYDDAWAGIMKDPELAQARSRLSLHEIRLIVAHAFGAGATIGFNMAARAATAAIDRATGTRAEASPPHDPNARQQEETP